MHQPGLELSRVSLCNCSSRQDGARQEEAGTPTHLTDSFPQCPRLTRMRNYALTCFFLKISCEDSVQCTGSSSGIEAAAAGVCRDVWVGTEREHSDKPTQPRGFTLRQYQGLRLPVVLRDHFSSGCRPRIPTTQRKAVIFLSIYTP